MLSRSEWCRAAVGRAFRAGEIGRRQGVLQHAGTDRVALGVVGVEQAFW
jgi:hypothetical protein